MSTARTRTLQFSERHIVSIPSDAGLTSIAGMPLHAMPHDPLQTYVDDVGAEVVISQIKSRVAVARLNVAHNCLGGDGFGKLFEYLCTDEGRKYEIEYLDVHNCDMSDTALSALSAYVRNNLHVRTLMMQQVRPILLK